MRPAPRFGYAWSPDDKTVIRGGYGLSRVSPEQIDYSLAPFQSPVNAATTTMVTSVNGSGLVPLNTLRNPVPNGLIQPQGHNVALLSNFEGQSFTTTRSYTGSAVSLYPAMEHRNPTTATARPCVRPRVRRF